MIDKREEFYKYAEEYPNGKRFLPLDVLKEMFIAVYPNGTIDDYPVPATRNVNNDGVVCEAIVYTDATKLKDAKWAHAAADRVTALPDDIEENNSVTPQAAAQAAAVRKALACVGITLPVSEVYKNYRPQETQENVAAVTNTYNPAAPEKAVEKTSYIPPVTDNVPVQPGAPAVEPIAEEIKEAPVETVSPVPVAEKTTETPETPADTNADVREEAPKKRTRKRKAEEPIASETAKDEIPTAETVAESTPVEEAPIEVAPSEPVVSEVVPSEPAVSDTVEATEAPADIPAEVPEEAPKKRTRKRKAEETVTSETAEAVTEPAPVEEAPVEVTPSEPTVPDAVEATEAPADIPAYVQEEKQAEKSADTPKKTRSKKASSETPKATSHIELTDEYEKELLAATGYSSYEEVLQLKIQFNKGSNEGTTMKELAETEHGHTMLLFLARKGTRWSTKYPTIDSVARLVALHEKITTKDELSKLDKYS